MADKNEKVIVVHNPTPQDHSWVRERFNAAVAAGAWKPHPGPQEEFFNAAGAVSGTRFAPSDKPGWGGCTSHVPELIPGTVQGTIFTEERMELEYSSLAPPPNPGWTYRPGSMTKKGNPK